MSNFIELEHCYLDITSVAIVDTVTMEIVLKSGYVVPKNFFTHLQVNQLARLIIATNTVYHDESLLFLHSQYVAGEIEKFLAFVQYDQSFKPAYEKKNDRVYTLEIRGKSGLVKWVRHFNQSDNLSHVLQAVEDLYEEWGGNHDNEEAGNEEAGNEERNEQ